MKNENTTGANKIFILIALGMFTFMSTLDGSIVNIAMPIMSKELQVSSSQIEWVVSIYLMTISSLLMFFGRLGDVIGKTRVFKIGTAVFLVGSFLAGLNMGLPFLLGSRALQAVGASMTMSNSFGITTSSFPMAQRGRAMGVIGTFVALGAVAGPAIGGLILNYLPWNYIFWINVPIGIIAILFGLKSLPKSETSSSIKDLDWLGTILFMLFVNTFFFAILQGQESGYSNPIIIGSLVVSLIMLFLFIRTENNSPKALLDLSIFRIADYSLGLLAALFVFINGFFFNVLIPYYLVNARGFSSGISGTLMSIIPLTMVVFGPLGGVLADRFGGPKITVIGLTTLLISQLIVVTFNLNTPMWVFFLASLLTGIGTGLFQSPNNAVVMSSVPTNRLGIAGSVNALARNLGMILGVSLSTTSLFLVMSMRAHKTITTYPTGQPNLFIYGMHIAFIISAVLLVVADLIAIERLRQGSKKATAK
ncbi:MFS transporter [Pediococcus argentinicus]|uniref:Major facilitator superfamily (MFS) profile domain-containing protein n=1 Tax=Pediococcus argentinicus TaxID=480391 RepID=A0A0R2NE10_9LACO|nr:MFS transporter [Pediococcus argentinicus]KRO22464.1 hypothetical protein IV88_GL001146 [Pediococcus argentinicus]NKZ23048.1 MFS transporter [Pediococcus argentinicus]GEP20146.1 MFS transporter [Pediococcus argentinicus]